MDKKNVVLLGASNSRMPGGIQAGLNQDNINFTNLSLGGTTSLHKLYSLKREENQEVLKKADLIVIEVNIMDISIFSVSNLNTTLRNIDYLYDELTLFNVKIMILILFDPRIEHDQNANTINNLHKYKAKEYGYNVIDINNIVNKFDLYHFFMKPDCYHMLTSIMYQLGKNIANNISCFHFPCKNKQFNHQFEIITPDELEIINGDFNKKIIRDLTYRETVYKIDKNHILKIPEKYNKFKLIGMHTFNNISLLINQKMGAYEKRTKSYSSLVLEQKKGKLIKYFWGYNTFQDISNNFILDKDTLVKFNLKEKYSELSFEVNYIDNYINTLDYVNLVSLFVVKEDPNAVKNINYDWLYQREINIDKKYNFDHLIPDLLLIKESVEEYCIKMDPIKQALLQNQINALNTQISNLNNEKLNLQNNFQAQLNSIPIKKQHLELANLEQDLIIKKLESKKLAKSLGIKMDIINPKVTFIQANSAKARIQNQL
ncbi:SGNH/GDSL hydrolase family protein, partial [Campylobacter sp. 2457A]|uniref:SGNH/GDSL hydrolase family protein n=1 Tax=Campylobacter sp. 2457A TaxID=2735784 RepID=UPI00301BC082|nr:SGNH/GDSL hydrolase family protein [Campylobacter sp. 2457A]